MNKARINKDLLINEGCLLPNGKILKVIDPEIEKFSNQQLAKQICKFECDTEPYSKSLLNKSFMSTDKSS